MTWTGASGTNWNTPGNWSLGFVPNWTDTATIPATGGSVTNYPDISGVTTIKITILTINGNMTANTNPGTITVLGTLTVGSGALFGNATSVGNLTWVLGTNSVSVSSGLTSSIGNLTVTAGAGTVSLSSDIYITNLVLSSGSLAATTHTLYCAGSVSQTGGVVNFTQNAAGGTLNMNGGGTPTLDPTGSSLNHLTISGGVTVKLQQAAILGTGSGGGNLLVSSGTLDVNGYSLLMNGTQLEGTVTNSSGTAANFTAQTGTLVLQAPTSITTNNGNIQFNTTVDGPYNLSLTAGTGTVAFNAAVGSVTKVGTGTGAAITIGTGVTTFGSTVATANGVSITPNVTFDNDVALDGAGTGNTTTSFAGNVTFSKAGSALVFTAGRTVNFGTTAANQVTLSTDGVSITTVVALNNGNLVFNAKVDGAQNLTVGTAGTGTVAFNAAVGSVTPIGTGTGAAITIGTGVTTFGSTVATANGVSITPNVTFDNTVDLDSTSTASSAAASTFSGTVTFSQGALQTFKTSHNATFNGTVAWTNALTIQGLTANNPSLTFNQPLDTTSNSSLTIDTSGGGTGTVTVNANIGATNAPGVTSIKAKNLTLAASITVKSNNNNITFQTDNLVNTAPVASVNAGTGTFQIYPLTASNTILFAQNNTTPAHNTFIDARWGSVTASAFIVGNGATQTGNIFVGNDTVGGVISQNYTVSIQQEPGPIGTGTIIIENDYTMTTGSLTLASGSGGITFQTPSTPLAINLGTGAFQVTGAATLNNDTNLTANGGITFSGAGSTVDGAHNLSLAASAGTVAFNAAVGSGTKVGTGTGAAITIGTGVTTFGSTVATANGVSITPNVTFDNDVALDALGTGDTTTSFAGNVTFSKAGSALVFTAGRTVNFGTSAANQVTLSTDGVSITTVVALNNGNLVFNSKVDGAQNLTVGTAGTGTVAFNAAVGSVTPIGTGTGAAITIGTGVTTFGSTVATANGVSITPNVTFDNDVALDGAGTGNTTTSFAGNVTFSKAGSALVFTAGRTVNFGTTAANQVTLSTDGVSITTVVALNNGNLVFNSKVDGAQNLTVGTAGTGTVAFNAAVGSVTPIGTGTGAAITIGTGVTTFGSTVATANGVSITPNVTFDNDVALDGAGTGDTTTSFAGNVTFSKAGSALVFTAGRTVNFGTTAANQVTLSTDGVSITTVVALNNGNLVFNAKVDGAQNLTVGTAGTGTVAFNAAVGSGTSVGSGTGAAITIGTGVTTFGSTVATANGVSITPNVTFDNDVALDALGTGDTTTSFAGNVTFSKAGSALVFTAGRTVNFGTSAANQVTLSTDGVSITTVVALNNGNLVFNAKVDGAQNLTVGTAGTGTVAFNAAVGSVTPIGTGTGAAITIGTGVTTFGSTVATANGVSITPNVTFDNDVALDGAGTGNTTTSFAGNVTFSKAGSALVFTAGRTVNFGTTAANQVTLSTDGVSITTVVALNNGNLVFNAKVDGAQNLTVGTAGTGTVAFNAAVGSVTKVGTGTGAAITIGTGVTTFGSTVATANGVSITPNVTFDNDVALDALGTGDTTTSFAGNVTFSKAGSALVFTAGRTVNFGTSAANQVTLSTDGVSITTVVALNNGNLVFNAKVDGAQNLTVGTAGTGTVAFNAAVGSVTPWEAGPERRSRLGQE